MGPRRCFRGSASPLGRALSPIWVATSQGRIRRMEVTLATPPRPQPRPPGKAVSQKPFTHPAPHSANSPVAPKQADPRVPRGRLPQLLLGESTLQVLEALFAGVISTRGSRPSTQALCWLSDFTLNPALTPVRTPPWCPSVPGKRGEPHPKMPGRARTTGRWPWFASLGRDAATRPCDPSLSAGGSCSGSCRQLPGWAPDEQSAQSRCNSPTPAGGARN